jgi:hypothetical protein
MLAPLSAGAARREGWSLTLMKVLAVSSIWRNEIAGPGLIEAGLACHALVQVWQEPSSD